MMKKRINILKLARSGFTLIEVLVSLAVFVVILGLVLANVSSFGTDILVGDVAYKLALTLREAQVYGSGVRALPSAGQQVDKADVGYGVRINFNLNSDTTSYVLYADEDRNGSFQASEAEIDKYDLPNGYIIKRACVKDVSAQSRVCLSKGIGSGFLDVAFIRPDPDARISINNPSPRVEHLFAEITVRSPQGKEKTVRVSRTGEIGIIDLPIE